MKWFVFMMIMAALATLTAESVKQNSTVVYQQAEIQKLQARVFDLEGMVTRDDEILNALLHGTWDRDCRYKRIPGELLADGSVRESLIQHCGE